MTLRADELMSRIREVDNGLRSLINDASLICTDLSKDMPIGADMSPRTPEYAQIRIISALAQMHQADTSLNDAFLQVWLADGNPPESFEFDEEDSE